ncbi:MAG: tetraacyldisaccharide 4'-kinase [Rhodospirillaceae bacterium]|nr:tetraacyldisaccharide 4'-kinase [Rhodospirillaceae bacterium]
MRPPAFWLTGGPLARLLEPVGALVVVAGWLRRRFTTTWQAPVPVFCIGNLTVGGTGKTPVALWLGRFLCAEGRHPAYVSRGYGGTAKGPLRVDVDRHGADVVGDEPLLLAGVAPTWIGGDRVAVARAAIAEGADCLILDDGFQNPALGKTLSLIVVDAVVGFGNGKVIPAGPCRELVRFGLRRADAVVLIGDDRKNLAPRLSKWLPVLAARLQPRADAQRLAGRDVVAFAGIGRPEKFFQTLADIGAQVVHRIAFDDHHPYLPADIQPILDEAYRRQALPVTTEKDAMRLPPDQRQQVDVVAVDVVWTDPEPLIQMLRAALVS